MSNARGISVARISSKMAQNQALMQHLQITQGSYAIFLLYWPTYIYIGLMYGGNKSLVFWSCVLEQFVLKFQISYVFPMYAAKFSKNALDLYMYTPS